MNKVLLKMDFYGQGPKREKGEHGRREDKGKGTTRDKEIFYRVKGDKGEGTRELG